MKIKLGTILALAFIGLGSFNLRAADVTLGGVTFDDSSIEVAANWLDPMPVGTTLNYEGTGTNAGRTRTISFSLGGEVGGVKTLKRHVVETGAAEKTEDIWIAFDTEDNSRVLKIVRNGAVAFEASTTTAPPVYIPADLTEGLSWESAGSTVTLVEVSSSFASYRIKITRVGADGQSQSDFLLGGEGIVQTECGSEENAWHRTTTETAVTPNPEPVE